MDRRSSRRVGDDKVNDHVMTKASKAALYKQNRINEARRMNRTIPLRPSIVKIHHFRSLSAEKSSEECLTTQETWWLMGHNSNLSQTFHSLVNNVHDDPSQTFLLHMIYITSKRPCFEEVLFAARWWFFYFDSLFRAKRQYESMCLSNMLICRRIDVDRLIITP